MRGGSNFAAASPYHIVGSRQVLLFLDVPFGGGFVLSYRWFALCTHVLRAQNKPNI